MRTAAVFWRDRAMTEGVARAETASFQHSAVSTASAGRKTRRLGMARREATCSTGWWVGPSSPTPMESCVITWTTRAPIRAPRRMAGRE